MRKKYFFIVFKKVYDFMMSFKIILRKNGQLLELFIFFNFEYRIEKEMPVFFLIYRICKKAVFKQSFYFTKYCVNLFIVSSILTELSHFSTTSRKK